MTTKATPLTALLSMMLLTAGGVASAATYFVSPSGSDANPGTLAAPWRTVQKAASSVRAGDVVNIRGGIYRERVQITVSGTAAARITFRSHPGETAVLDGTGLTLPNYTSPLLRMMDRNYITIENLELRNLITTSDTTVPVGIYIDGSGTGIHIRGCRIHTIHQNNTKKHNFNANAHGIAVYGNSKAPISGLIVENCQLYNLRLGASEALVLNGNVTNFQILNNTVRDCNNIGIDLIGYEGTNRNPELDRARDGVVQGNKVYNIDSSTNPAYGGGLTTGGGVRCAAGIYIDGGTRILVERNEVYQCNIGVELASEHAWGTTDFITLRNNVLRQNQVTGLSLGGYDSKRGATRDCTITNNTIVLNDTTTSWSGQIQFQHYVSRCILRNNVVVAPSRTKQMIIGEAAFGTGNVIDYNLYHADGASTRNLEFVAGGKSYTTLEKWQALGFDKNSIFASAGFVSPASNNFNLTMTSPCINRGDPAFKPATGERDFAGGSRLGGARVDIGADEQGAN